MSIVLGSGSGAAGGMGVMGSSGANGISFPGSSRTSSEVRGTPVFASHLHQGGFEGARTLDAYRPDNADGPILRNTFGEPWTTDGFKTSWGKAVIKSGLSDENLHFHDLRGTAVTRLALAGCTVPEIASITGHSLQDVEAILKAHYLGGQVELAEQAIIKLNAKYADENKFAK
jgi:hypothetical protein